MTVSRLVILLDLCIIAMALPASRAAQPATSPSDDWDIAVSDIWRTDLARRSEQALSRGVRFLLSEQNPDGSWGMGQATDEEGGNTALVTLALLSCGESHQSAAIQRAIAFLKRVQPDKTHHATYSIALRACVWASLPEPLRQNELRADLRWLLDAMIKSSSRARDGRSIDRRGMYDYNVGGSGLGGDYSNSQYAVLGVWYAADAGLEVPRAYWKQVEDGWLAGQCQDGGWAYMPGRRRSYASMTAAAAATLYITNDYLHARQAQNLAQSVSNEPLERAMNWLGENFAADLNVGRDILPAQQRQRDRALLNILGDLAQPPGTQVHYMLFAYERVGEASGLTRFGRHKWFDEGAEFLIRTQARNGSWRGSNHEQTDTAYALLFLSRGRAPIVLQKLQFDGRWNNRPRDAWGFTRFMRRASERHVNWQVVGIDHTPQELRQSPLLYVASDQPLALDRTHKARLKDYIDQGGLLVCVNEGSTDAFARSIRELAAELYPQYPMRDLPADHPAYTANFPVPRGGDHNMLRGVNNGLRELIVLYPGGDMSWKWHSAGGAFLPRNSAYATLANLYLYVTDRANRRFKGEDTWIDRDPLAQPTRSLRIARLRHRGNWDPEPAGWVRLANLLANRNGIELQVEPVFAPDPAVHRLAHITDTRSLQFDESEKARLRKYIDGGGVLLLDAAGGSPEAAASFEPLLRQLYPDHVTIESLPLDHQIYRMKSLGGENIDRVRYRRRQSNLDIVPIPRLRAARRDGRIIAIISSEDLSGGLVGYLTAGLEGYAPGSAISLVRNILLWRLEHGSAPPD